jgi:hypothetical protein
MVCGVKALERNSGRVFERGFSGGWQMFGNLLSVFNLGFPIQFRTTFCLIEDAHKRRVHLEFDHVLPDFFRRLLC